MLLRNAVTSRSLRSTGRSSFEARHHGRAISSAFATRFAEGVKHSSSKYQVYISNSSDPFINLSIEHYLLQNSHKASTVLLLYVNRPCVIIGRNQNPWLETNLHQFRHSLSDHGSSAADGHGRVELVRRRSGGGTVFHDGGNVNYSVICPPADFNRDKHAEMIVHALRPTNPRARVNERHDIVLDQGDFLSPPSRPKANDHHNSGFGTGSFLKVSGSAYKLTRDRSLHHGTCLVNSPNIGNISRFLRSPAAPYIKARGVDSVRSPVGNVYPPESTDAVRDFQRNAVKAFMHWHGVKGDGYRRLLDGPEAPFLEETEEGIVGRLDAELVATNSISKGVEELKSPEWTFAQTPQFEFSSHATEDDSRPRPPLPVELPQPTRVFLKARNGALTETEISTSGDAQHAMQEARALDMTLNGLKIHDIESWKNVLRLSPAASQVQGIEDVAAWLDRLFGKA